MRGISLKKKERKKVVVVVGGRGVVGGGIYRNNHELIYTVSWNKIEPKFGQRLYEQCRFRVLISLLIAAGYRGRRN